MAEYLLEIGLEEVPAGIMGSVLRELQDNFKKGLASRHIPAESVEVYGTSRRIAVIVGGLPEKGDSLLLETKGPSLKAAYKDGVPSKALEGFCRSQGILPEETEVRVLGKESYVYAVRREEGLHVRNTIPEIVRESISSLYFPKPMAWGDSPTTFIRPIRHLVSLWNQDILPLSYGGLEGGRISSGHRFLSKGIVEIESPRSYLDTLRKAYVLADPRERMAAIHSSIETLEENNGFKAVLPEALLEEVLYLVEYPTAFLGKFREAYLELPEEVIMTTMVHHQKYFPVRNPEGALMALFLGVRCGDSYGLDTVSAGNEKVLRARLEDAAFFYREDRKTPLLSLREKLDKVIYQKDLGSLGAKVDRIEALTQEAARMVGADPVQAQLAARLSKMDLASHMVYEFPELQGIMGKYYALGEGYPAEVAASIQEHYLPNAAGDAVPNTPLSIALSLGDKFDTIAGIFKAGLIPSGSQDPFALRRMALGILRTIVENRLSLDFQLLVEKAQKGIPHLDDVSEGVLDDFFKGRFRTMLEREGLRFDLVDSILALPFTDVLSLWEKAAALKAMAENPAFPGIVSLLVRTGNILRKNPCEYTGVNEELLSEDAERQLWLAYLSADSRQKEALSRGDYLLAMRLLEDLEEPLQDFFQEVMVMAEDEKVKINRLSLLKKISELGDSLFDAGCIVQNHE